MSDIPPAELVVYVAGTPRPQPRPRFVNGRVVSTASKAARIWRAAVMAACLQAKAGAQIPSGPVRLAADFWFATPRAERWGKPHTNRPDGDNILKLVQDVAERAGLLPKGDAYVASLQVTKTWAREAGALMTVRPIGSETSEGTAQEPGTFGEEPLPEAA